MNLKNVRHLREVLATDAQGKTISTMQSEGSGRIRAQIAELQQAMMVLGQAALSVQVAAKQVSRGTASRAVRTWSKASIRRCRGCKHARKNSRSPTLYSTLAPGKTCL